MFTAMMALNQLAEVGLAPRGDHSGNTWQRPALLTTTVPDARPHGLAAIPAAAGTMAWKPHQPDR